MKHKVRTISILIYLVFIFGVFSTVKLDISESTYTDGCFSEPVTVNTSSSKYANVTVISDGFGGIYWNDGESEEPSVAVDNDGNIHVVWSDNTPGPWGSDVEIMYANYSSSVGWSNATVISDDDTKWNNRVSRGPSIAVDYRGNIHVVWSDGTDGPWGIDEEIMYANYSTSAGWSNATVISDDNTDWNLAYSYEPSIAVDNNGDVHVVWYDGTNGPWGIDEEIMYANYSTSAGWSNATVISDDATTWNSGDSGWPSIAVDISGNVHVVWRDDTPGPWGSDVEIMYVNYSSSTGWSNVIVISDDDTNWNIGGSWSPSIVGDNSGYIHVVWDDDTNGLWGTDYEIMYVNYSSSAGWSNATVISDGFEGIYWNDGNGYSPSMAIDNGGYIHVVWQDQTPGPWGTGDEIMYVNCFPSTGWSNVTVISDGYGGIYWNDDSNFEPSIAVDNSGNAHVVYTSSAPGPWDWDKEITYTFIDDVAPAITINSPILNEFIGTVAPHFNISIVEPKLYATWYTLDDGVTNIAFNGFTGTINQTEWDKKGNGTVTIRFYGSDTLGNEGYDEVTVRKDTITPNSSISYVVHKEPNEVNKSTTFTLTADDGSGSGVSVIRYKIDDSDWFEYSTPFNLSQYVYGDVLISYQAIDEVGNIEAANTELVKLARPPTEGVPLAIILIAVFSTAGGIGVAAVVLVLLRKRRGAIPEE